MTPAKGGYAVDVPVINVSERARRENATVWSTFRAFGVTLRRLFNSLFKGDMPTISYPEEQRNYSERFRGTHILTVRDDGSLKCNRPIHNPLDITQDSPMALPELFAEDVHAISGRDLLAELAVIDSAEADEEAMPAPGAGRPCS